MHGTAQGLSKIWREIKRPFEQLLGLHGVHARQTNIEWNVESEKLHELFNRLVAHTDNLSREVAARFITRRLFCSESANRSSWSIFEQCLKLIHPLDYADQERIKTLGKEYRCPYTFPQTLFPEHRATHFSFNQFPLEIQKTVAGKDIIDGGGFLGDSAMVFTEYYPRKVYTFEPNPETIPVMRDVFVENAAVLGNRKNLIEIVPMALGRTKGTAVLHSSGAIDGSATLLEKSKRKHNTVDVTSIDEFTVEHGLTVGLIKLDVEGAEYDTILGAKETICKQKPLLLVSLYHTFKDFFEIKPLVESWNLGYQFAIRHHHPSAPDWEFILMAH